MTQTAHASGLNSVERQLAALHLNMLTAGRGGDGDGVVRFSVLTLVAICSDERDADVVEEAVRHISFSHPARAIIIVADPSAGGTVEADLSLISTPDRVSRICAEQVRLLVGGEQARHLASLVVPLLLPDVPIYVWLIGSESVNGDFERDAMQLGAPLIIDSGSHAAPRDGLASITAALQRHPDLVLADIAWARGRGWREHIAQAFNGSQARPFVRSITRVEVDSAGSEPSAQAWLTAGWLSGRLEGDGGRGPDVLVSASDADEIPNGDLQSVRIFATTAAHRCAVIVDISGGRIHTRVHIDGGSVEHRAVPFASPNVVRVVGSLLEQPSDDLVYVAALNRGALLAGTRE